MCLHLVGIDIFMYRDSSVYYLILKLVAQGGPKLIGRTWRATVRPRTGRVQDLKIAGVQKIYRDS
jgi:hypothetical protein